MYKSDKANFEDLDIFYTLFFGDENCGLNRVKELLYMEKERKRKMLYHK